MKKTEHVVNWAELGAGEEPDGYLEISDGFFAFRKIHDVERETKRPIKSYDKDAEDYQLLESMRTVDGHNPYQKEQNEILMRRIRSHQAEGQESAAQEQQHSIIQRFSSRLGSIIGSNIRQP